MILTIEEIRDLALFAGLTVGDADASEMETEICITDCHTEGIFDDNGVAKHYAHVAYLEEYPEEGVHGLGREITK